MAKFYGKIGFAESKESSPGVWIEEITEKSYYGDIINDSRRLQASDKVNDDITLSNNISIIADPYAKQNIHAIRYAEFMGTKWKVNNAEARYPRIVMYLGGVYNG